MTILAAVLLPVIGIAVAGAVDFGRMASRKSALQAAADSASLAAANSQYTSDSERVEFGQKYFQANTEKNGLEKSTALIKIRSGEVAVEASQEYTFLFPFIATKKTINVVSKSGISSTPTRVLDIAMCIDATTSMTATIPP